MRKFKNAYTAGRNAGLVGANTSNCHFGWFSTPEHTAEWERGNRDGKIIHRKKPDNPAVEKLNQNSA